ncbi:MAG: flippase-like domain-containing protein [Planctomycetes bacterium]|nr:flippase-like domain-containing protein [Planctomycetota bacterium]
MKRILSIALRLLGLALVCFVLWRIQYRDLYDPDGIGAPGRVEVSGETARFVRSSGEVLPLSADWSRDGRVRLGLFTLIRLSEKAILLLCIFAFGPITLLSIYRWFGLLRAAGIRTSFGDAFRLSYIGFFFNSAVPGLTGGDIVKAFYIARQSPGMRVRAFMSVLVDRMIGLFVLGLLAAAVILPRAADPRFHAAAVIVFLFVGGCLLFGVLFLSRRLRRWVRFEALIARLPFARLITEVDQGIFVYRDRPRAVWVSLGLSVLNHLAIVTTAVGMGYALGGDLRRLPILEYFILVPVCSMLASIPALPGGWGVREGAFAFFFGMVGIPGTQSVALSILIGISQLLWSMLGGWFFLTRPDRASARDLRSFAAASEADEGGVATPS